MLLPISFLILCTLLFLITIKQVLDLYRKRNLPPGPNGLPFLGNLFDIGPNPHKSLANLAKKYGPLMTITQGSVTTIVVSSADMARQVLQKQDEAFSGRIVPNAITKLEHSSHAVAWLPVGDEWRLTRRVLCTFLTNVQKLELLTELRHNVVLQMVQHVKEVGKCGVTVGINKLAFITAMNQMSNTCFSVNVCEYEDEDDGNGFKDAVTAIMKLTCKFNVSDYFPLFRCLDPQRLRHKAKVAYGCLEELCDNYIYHRLQQRVSSSARHGDLLDSFLDFSQENEADFNLKHIQVLLVELFLAGTETSSITTEWAMTELIRRKDIMVTLRKEISETVREKGRIEEAEILRLPYLQAVVKETMRLHLAVPFLVPHKTERDEKLKGYHISKNTQVLVNTWAIARDAEFWDKPTCFMPERFLNNEMDFKGQHFAFLPFGSGRRMCPGIPLAHRVVSLMIASLVYHFDWKLPNGMKPEDLDMNESFALTLQRKKQLVAVPETLN